MLKHQQDILHYLMLSITTIKKIQNLLQNKFLITVLKEALNSLFHLNKKINKTIMKRTKKEMKKIYEEFNVFFEVSGYDLFFFETQDFNIIVKENLDEIKRKEIVKVLSTRFDVHHKTIYNFIERYYYDTLEYFDMCNDELQRILEK